LPNESPVPIIEFVGATRIDISRLSPAERLQLVEELWDSLSSEDIPLTPAQVEELDRREALHRANPKRGRPWREVLDEIERG
jgi:putative addiction module component (TIGR02574 family)